MEETPRQRLAVIVAAIRDNVSKTVVARLWRERYPELQYMDDAALRRELSVRMAEVVVEQELRELREAQRLKEEHVAS